MYTRCPKCSTCFRVTDRHLAIAKGKVRCGKCQLVFNAPEHAIDDLPSNSAATTQGQEINKPSPSVSSTTQAEVTKPVKAEVTKPVTPVHKEKVAVTPTKEKIEKPVKPAEVKKEKAAAIPPPKVAPPLFQADATMVADSDSVNKEAAKEAKQETPPSPHDAFHIEDDSFDDNFDLDAAIDELTHSAEEITYDYDSTAIIEEPHKPRKKTSASQKKTVAEKTQDEKSDDVFSTDAYDATNASSVADILNEMEGQMSLNIDEPTNEIKGDYDADDEFEFIELDDEPDTEFKVETQAEKENQKSEETNDEFIKNNFDIEEFGIEDDDDLFDDDEPEKNIVEDKKAAEQEALDEFDLSGFEESEVSENIVLDESHEDNIGKHSQGYEVPLQLRDDIDNLQAPSARQLHPAIKLSFVVILLVLSFSQVAYFRAFELVNIIPESRPLLESFCENIGCQYSGPQDTKQIELMSRDVRLHPKEKKALLISAAMINNAYFAQPYPNIHIRLSDISGNVVAERTFNPKTYMGKLSNPFLLMRSKTPVHINFEVVDPGKDAVNFEFTFL